MVCQAANRTRSRISKRGSGIRDKSGVKIRVAACFQSFQDCQAQYFRLLLKPVTRLVEHSIQFGRRMAGGGGGDGSLPWHWHPEKPGEEMGRRANDNNAASLATFPSVTTFQLSDAHIFLIWRNFAEKNGFPSIFEQGNMTAYEYGSEYLKNHTPAVAVNPLISGGEGSGNQSGIYNRRNNWVCNSEGATEESEEWNEEDESREIDLLMHSSSGEGEDWGEGEEDEEMSTGHYSPREEGGVDGKQWDEETVGASTGCCGRVHGFGRNEDGCRGGHFVD